MALTFDTALIAESDLVKLTGIQDLANLELPAELDLIDLIKAATNYFVTRLETLGVDPSLIINQTRLNAAVAYETVRRLAVGGYVDPLQDRAASVALFQEEVDREWREFKPDTSGDDSRVASEGIPRVANVDRHGHFGRQTVGTHGFPTHKTHGFDDLATIL